ncbi:MAG: hypothetical protein ABJB97_00950 [Acidobacteriota bacterium]
MKYLVIAALLAILFLLVYSRVRPYLVLLRKVSSALKDSAPTSSAPASRSGSIKSENKLVRCVACETWIPAERAIGGRSLTSIYCSHECLEKTAKGKERKLAG